MHSFTLFFKKVSAATMLLLLSTGSRVGFAQKNKQHAHVHGAAKLAIAIDSQKVSFDLDTPAEGLYGFEHEPKTPAEKKAVVDAHAQFTSHADDLFRFSKESGCTTTKTEVKKEGETGQKQPPAKQTHSDVNALVEFNCTKPVAGSKVVIALIQKFPHIKSIQVQIISDKIQRAETIKKPEHEMDL